MLNYEQLAKAARDHDETAKGGAEDAIISAGLDPLDAWRVAEQRAIQLVLIVTGNIELIGLPITLTDEQTELMQLMKLAWMDGACIRGAAA